MPAAARRAALAADRGLPAKPGRAFRVGELATEYRLTDIDGGYVPPFIIPADESPGRDLSRDAIVLRS